MQATSLTYFRRFYLFHTVVQYDPRITDDVDHDEMRKELSGIVTAWSDDAVQLLYLLMVGTYIISNIYL